MYVEIPKSIQPYYQLMKDKTFAKCTKLCKPLFLGQNFQLKKTSGGLYLLNEKDKIRLRQA